MDEILIALLYGLGEILLEAFGELLFEEALAFAFRFFRSKLAGSTGANAILAACGYFFLGMVFGAASVLLFPHFIFPRSRIQVRFHGISLLLSPVLTGLVMSLLGSVLRRRGKQAVPIESFRYGFAFAFGMALIRFFFVS